jgi:hypothetical protein
MVDHPLHPFSTHVSDLGQGHASQELSTYWTYSSGASDLLTGFTVDAFDVVIHFSAHALHQHGLSASVGDINCEAAGHAFNGYNAPQGAKWEPLHMTLPFIATEPGYLYVQQSTLSVGGFGWDDEHGYAYSKVDAGWKVIDSNNNLVVSDAYSVQTNVTWTEQWEGEREFPISAGEYQFETSYNSRSTSVLTVGRNQNMARGFQSGDNYVVTLRFRRHPFLLGDVNDDGVVNFDDINPFVMILASGEYDPVADINQDGEVNFDDINPFIELLR